jgi:hypothetical protein
MSPAIDASETRAAGLLVGAWRLRSCEARSDSGEVSYPYGQNPVGYITYSASGYMAVSIMGGDPPRIDDEADVLTGTARAIQAGHAYIGYAGTFRVEGMRAGLGDALEGTVCHTLETASFPNWVGTTQRREFHLTATTLTLITPPITRQGVRAVATLIWDRT